MSSSTTSSAIPVLTAGKILPLARQMSGSASTGSAAGSQQKGVKVEKITVFGAGLMGAGIAQVGAQNGYKVSGSLTLIISSRIGTRGREI